MNAIAIGALVATISIGIATGAGYRWGHHDAELVAQKAQLAAQKSQMENVNRAISQANERAAEDAEILRASEQVRVIEQTRTIIRVKEAARHVAENPDLYARRLDACGVCLARTAAAGTDPSACACESDGAPATATRSGQRH